MMFRVLEFFTKNKGSTMEDVIDNISLHFTKLLFKTIKKAIKKGYIEGGK